MRLIEDTAILDEVRIRNYAFLTSLGSRMSSAHFAQLTTGSLMTTSDKQDYFKQAHEQYQPLLLLPFIPSKNNCSNVIL